MKCDKKHIWIFGAIVFAILIAMVIGFQVNFEKYLSMLLQILLFVLNFNFSSYFNIFKLFSIYFENIGCFIVDISNFFRNRIQLIDLVSCDNDVENQSTFPSIFHVETS